MRSLSSSRLRTLTLSGALGLFLHSPAQAGEFAIFSSGSRLAIDRHEFSGNTVRLFQGQGFTDVPVGAILNFENNAPSSEPIEPILLQIWRQSPLRPTSERP